MTSPTSLFELETLFIEKLQEKYKLNLRDIKRAFARFDLDKNGLLDLGELTTGVQLFLNGVKTSQVQELVAQYDVNGDGKISYEEFLGFLSTRSAIDPSQEDEQEVGNIHSRGSKEHGGRVAEAWSDSASSDIAYFNDQRPRQPQDQRREVLNVIEDVSDEDEYHSEDNYVTDAPSQRPSYAPRADGRLNIRPGTATSDMQSEMDLTNPVELETRAKQFFSQLRTQLIKQAAQQRLAGEVKHANRYSLPELQEKLAKEALSKAFQRYTGQGDGRVKGRQRGVDYPDFVR
jgi:Ca2+-binding EF-hand superfamily protein